MLADPLTESDSGKDESAPKKGRRRKKQLYNSILQQMEFYFSDSNLSKDRYFGQLVGENPNVDLTVFTKFNKIRKLTTSIEDIKKAIGKSNLIELSEDGQTVFRKTPYVKKSNVDDCTIYVEKIKADATHEWLTSVFAEFGNVVYVSIPKYKSTQMNKGFAFVEFDTEKEAEHALEYFESIGCRMPAHLNPEELCSIATFNKGNESEVSDGTKSDHSEESKKRKRLSTDGENKDDRCKKLKSDDETNPKEHQDSDTDAKKKKKQKKEHKKRNYIKEMGLQVLSKKEWKKMRNHYLDLQKKKMKEFKNYLNKMKFSHQQYSSDKGKSTPSNAGNSERVVQSDDTASDAAGPKSSKIEFVPGVIVKINLNEQCSDPKKLKNDIKALSPGNIKFVDVPLPGSQTIYIRFISAPSAADFCKQEGFGERVVLQGYDEEEYWKKLNNDRITKFEKTKKKERGRTKLLRKARQHIAAQHIRFDEESN